MGCGCGKNISKSKQQKSGDTITKQAAIDARKKRVTKLISIPGKSTTKK